jgi:hypothetical protein
MVLASIKKKVYLFFLYGVENLYSFRFKLFYKKHIKSNPNGLFNSFRKN